MNAKCPKKGCDGIDSCYFVDDLTYHKCDKCGTTWETYDPEEKVENALNINQPL